MRLLSFFLLFSTSFLVHAQTIYEPLRLDEVEASLEDFGHMWTFDAVPVERFEKNLGFRPTDEWLDKVQKSALQFGGGCSGSFVSGSGLIMTNHHCVRGSLLSKLEDGPKILEKGFYAPSLEEEPKVEGLYVDQLIQIEDVTLEIAEAMKAVDEPGRKILVRDSIKEALAKERAASSGLVCRVVTLYQGGKFALYSWKRYSDIRLVMVPSFQMASTGWDWDNYTYPRYELDMAFLRAYDENGEPVDPGNFFKWNVEGANPGDPIFVVGRPGSTDRLLSYRQLEYLRDVATPLILDYFNAVFQVRYAYFQNHPERSSELFSSVLGVSNGRKRYAGRLLGLKDPYLMTKKRKFEEGLKNELATNPDIQDQAKELWKELESTLVNLENITPAYYAAAFPRSMNVSYLQTANNLLEFSEQMDLDEEERKEKFQKANLKTSKKKLFEPQQDRELDSLFTLALADFWSRCSDPSMPSYLKLFPTEGGNPFTFLKGNTILDDPKKVDKLIKGGSKKINASSDPLLSAAMELKKNREKYLAERKIYLDELAVLNQKLGAMVYEMYGDEISPDGTGTLRISEGKIEGYEYNGTLAPPKTTFYGLYNRYFGFGQKPYPWGLDSIWQKPTSGFDLSTPINFCSTNDIVGGNSGSTIIDKNGMAIGLAFDGNLESIPGYFAYLPAKNRTIGVDSKGIIESLRTVYKYPKLVQELELGKVSD